MRIISNRNSTTTRAPRHRLRWDLRVSIVVLVIVGAASAESGPETDPITLTILVHNYSQASRAVIMAAEREAGRILGEAGVQAVWLECKVDRSTADTQELCRKPVEATDIQLRILSAPIRNQYRDTVFGFVVNPVLASVFYDYVVRLAKEDDAQFELPIVLGCVIAHEIGHLLLGADSHSGSGLMQRQWRRESVRKAMTGALLFSAEESEVIRAEARRRMRVPKASLSEHGY